MTTLGGMIKAGIVVDISKITMATKPLDLPTLVASMITHPAFAQINPPHGLTLMAALQAWTDQDDDAHEPCSLTACRHPLHPGPCKGWKGTLHQVSPGTYRQLEDERVRKANERRVKRIADLRSQNKPIPRRLLAEIKPKPAPVHPAHNAQAVPLGQVNQKADLAGGQAHTAGQAVTKAAGVKVSTAPLPLGPKKQKPTVAGRGPAFVITQPKVTDQYKLDKAAKITPQEWNGLSDADKTTIRHEITAIKARGFGPQQRKSDELLARLPAPSAAVGKTLAPGTPGTITTPKGNVHPVVNLAPGKVSLGQAIKPPAPAQAAPATPAPHRHAGLPDSVQKALAPGSTLTPAEKTYAYRKLTKAQFGGLNDADKKKILDDLDRQIAAGTGPVPVAKALKDDFSPAPSSTPGVSGTPPTPAQAAPASSPGRPAVLPAHAQAARAVAARTFGGPPTGKKHLTAYGQLSKDDFDNLDAKTQKTIRDDLANAKAKFLDPKKQQAAQDLLDRFGSKHPAPAAPAGAPDTTTMTPVNVAALIRKNGSADLMIGGKKVTVGFHGGGHEGKLEMVPGGQYVVTTSDGTKHHLAKGQHVTVATKTAASPSAPAAKGYSDPMNEAVKAAASAALSSSLA